VTQCPVFVEFQAAVAAKAAAQMIFRAAAGAAVGEFAAGHGDKAPFGPIDDFQIANDEHVVERDRTEGMQPFVIVFFLDELNPYFCNVHGGSP
jgi:hypothetical protein